MGDEAKPAKPAADYFAFNHLLQEFLQDKESDGIFVGEKHQHPALRQSIIRLMPLLKANGVGTISLELPQEFVDQAVNGASLDTWQTFNDPRFTARIPDAHYPDEFYHLIREATKHGIKVLGHESFEIQKQFVREISKFRTKLFTEVRNQIVKEIDEEKDPEKRAELVKSAQTRFEQRINDTLTNDEKVRAELNKIHEEYNPEKAAAMRKRNEFAADHVNANKVQGKKVVVIGGASHSIVLGHERWPGSESTQREGLDDRLNLKTVIFNISDEKGKVGATKKTMYNDRVIYEVMFPADLAAFLKSRNITSWPPSDGVPTIDSPLKQSLPMKQNTPGQKQTVPPPR